jgi:hypothetical protein
VIVSGSNAVSMIVKGFHIAETAFFLSGENCDAAVVSQHRAFGLYPP